MRVQTGPTLNQRVSRLWRCTGSYQEPNPDDGNKLVTRYIWEIVTDFDPPPATVQLITPIMSRVNSTRVPYDSNTETFVSTPGNISEGGYVRQIQYQITSQPISAQNTYEVGPFNFPWTDQVHYWDWLGYQETYEGNVKARQRIANARGVSNWTAWSDNWLRVGTQEW